jgi:hypothetical protein
MVELSRDGRGVYVTNSIYGAWDPVFYPDEVGAAWLAKPPDPPGWRGHLKRLVLFHQMTTAAPPDTQGHRS